MVKYCSILDTYTDIISFQWKCFHRDITTWEIAENLVIASVPFDCEELFIFQCKRTIELDVMASQNSVWDVNLEVAEATCGYCKEMKIRNQVTKSLTRIQKSTKKDLKTYKNLQAKQKIVVFVY